MVCEGGPELPGSAADHLQVGVLRVRYIMLPSFITRPIATARLNINDQLAHQHIEKWLLAVSVTEKSNAEVE